MTRGRKRNYEIDLTQTQLKRETLNIFKNSRYDLNEPMWSVLDRLAKDKEELLYQLQYWHTEAINRQKIIESGFQKRFDEGETSNA